MATPIYAWYLVHLDYVEIKFVDTISTVTLVNENFELWDVTPATPLQVANAFNEIDLTRDYYSISRTLHLWFANPLEENKDYEVRISGLKTVVSEPISSDVLPFTVGETDSLPSTTPITKDPVDVEDYSIKDVSTFFASTIPAVGDTLSVVSVKPDLEKAFYLDSSYNEGRIEITFNTIPAANYISGDYFKVERKLIVNSIVRWETVSTIVASNPDTALVVIYLPSTDATPVYGEPDVIYWEPGYKYRLRISAQIGI